MTLLDKNTPMELLAIAKADIEKVQATNKTWAIQYSFLKGNIAIYNNKIYVALKDVPANSIQITNTEYWEERNYHYLKLTNGLIIQWGTYTNGNNWNRSLTATITLPISFNTTTYTVTITPKMWNDGNTFRNASIGWQNKSNSQFYASIYGVGSADSCNGFSWLAIGF